MRKSFATEGVFLQSVRNRTFNECHWQAFELNQLVQSTQEENELSKAQGGSSLKMSLYHFISSPTDNQWADHWVQKPKNEVLGAYNVASCHNYL